MTERTKILGRTATHPWPVVLTLALLLTACSVPTARDSAAVPAPIGPVAQPEAATGATPKPGWVLRQHAVAAANPLATEAGVHILRAGGSAVDAAIAVQMVLTLVEPQSSGIGGGAFLLHHDGQRVQAFDGRETAPAAATEKLFLADDGQPLPFLQAVVGGRSVGVPGTVAMQKRLAALGPQRLTLPAGALRGHTFHYSRCVSTLEPVRRTEAARNSASAAGEAMFRSGSVQASYFHAWFASSPAATASLFLPGGTD